MHKYNELFLVINLNWDIKKGFRVIIKNEFNMGLAFLKNLLGLFLSPIIILIRYVRKNTKDENTLESLYYVVKNRAVFSSAEYIEKNISKAMLFDKKEKLWDFALSKISVQGEYVEFGVFSGFSINYFSKKIKNVTFYGFDSFEGLKEDWFGTFMAKGAFSLKGVLPKVNSNVSLIKGWFDSTLPNFLKSNTQNFSFIHFDADTYESTVQLLNLMGNRIVSGTVVIFDEYLGFPNWQNGEYLAWKQFVEKNNINYDYLGFSTQQVAIKIK